VTLQRIPEHDQRTYNHPIFPLKLINKFESRPTVSAIFR